MIGNNSNDTCDYRKKEIAFHVDSRLKNAIISDFFCNARLIARLAEAWIFLLVRNGKQVAYTNHTWIAIGFDRIIGRVRVLLG